MGEYHLPIMLDECLEGLSIKENGIYCDVTFGGGGHSRKIVESLNEGRLYSFDQDEDAPIESLLQDERFHFFPHNFKNLERFLRVEEVGLVDGILADLGVSSHQINEPERGFSFRFDAALDMRMDRHRTKTAYDVINTYSEKDLSDLFFLYGELRNSRKLAARLCETRKVKALSSTFDFKNFLLDVQPKGSPQYLAQAFQAIRIEVNDELKALEMLLEQSARVLKPGGRLVVLSFHSLEDRMVKNFIRSGDVRGEEERDVFGNFYKPLKAINRKPITASEEELANNSRSRSAKLRIAEKTLDEKKKELRQKS